MNKNGVQVKRIGSLSHFMGLWIYQNVDAGISKCLFYSLTRSVICVNSEHKSLPDKDRHL